MRQTTKLLAAILLISLTAVSLVELRSTLTPGKSHTLPSPVTPRLVSPADFSISADPGDLAVSRGSSATSNIVVSSLNGLSGSVTLSATSLPSGLTLSISPSSGSLTSGCSCVFVLTVSTTTGTTTGLYNVTATATSGSISHSTVLQVAVTPITFPINDREVFTGIVVNTTGAFTVDSPSNVFTVSGTATVVATNATTGTALLTQTYTVSKQPLYYPYQGGYQANLILYIGVSPYPLGFHFEPQLAGPSASAPGSPTTYKFVYRDADINGDGFVTWGDVNAATASYGCSIGQSCYNPRADLNGDGTVTINDVSVVAFFFQAIDYGVTSYSLSSSTTSMTVNAGTSTTATITLASILNYAGTVGLVATVSPSGPTASLTPSSITLNSGGSGSSTLSVSAGSSTPVGFYTVKVNATSGTRTHTIAIQVVVVDFAISANPGDLAIHNGSSGTSVISIAPVGEFTGTVSLSASVTPSGGPTVSLSSSSLTISGCGSTTTLTISAHGPAGLYNVIVTATSGSISHSVTVQVPTSPETWSVNNSQVFSGVNVNTTGSLSLDSPSSITLSGSFSVVAKNATTGTTLFSKTYTITNLPYQYANNGGFEWHLLLNVAVNPYPLAVYMVLDLTAPTSTTPGAPVVTTILLLRNADINANGIVDQTDLNTITAAYGCSIGQSCYNPRADLNGDGTVTINDVSVAAFYFGAPDFI